jgi:hypothetical protein
MDARILANWVDPERYGWVIHPQTDRDWETVIQQYGGIRGAERAFTRLIEVVRANECKTVIIENRYVDSDFRSEYTAFWASRFTDTPAFARRMHFFSDVITESELHDLEGTQTYLGYAVLRPTRLGPLGRTMIKAPPEHVEAVHARVRDVVNLFGNRLEIEAAPFCQQDREFLTCSQVCSWMCHYAAARRNLVARQTTAALIEAAPAFLSEERPLPSHGLNLNQIQAVFGTLGQPALHYGLRKMPDVLGVEIPAPQYERRGLVGRVGRDPGHWDRRIFSVVCRYLNSRFPVLIATDDHTFVIFGWFRDKDNRIRFIANDDRAGPYIEISSPFEYRAPWRSIMVPLPPKVYMSGESAENEAWRRLRFAGLQPEALPGWREIADGIQRRTTHALRVSLQRSNEYKRRALDRGLHDAAVREICLANLPRYVWVVEARNRAEHDAGRSSVAGEVVFDSTSQEVSPQVLILHLPGEANFFPPDPGSSFSVPTDTRRWGSSIPLPVD